MWLVYPALSCVLVLMPGTGWLLVLLAAIGCISGAYDPVEVTIHQELISPDLRARAFAVLLAAEMSVVPLLMLLYGFLFDAAGLRPALLLFAARKCSWAATPSATGAPGCCTRPGPCPRSPPGPELTASPCPGCPCE